MRRHLASVVDAPLSDVQQFTNGAANLTYLLRFGDRELVLRRPPSGTIAPGAHDMKREWRVLSRLWRHFDRAPRAFLFCDDHAIAGADFFVMEHRPGVVIRGEIPAALTAHADVARRMSFALIDAIAELHGLDPKAADVADIGKPIGFVARQVSGWRKRWELAEARSSKDARGEMTAIGARLERAVPAPQRASIVHNDLKLDNCAFDPRDPDRVSSIFDWDMTTLGDPLVDLGTLLNYWPDPADAPDVRRGSHDGMRSMGLPPRAALIARYAERTGADLASVRWWEAFALWKTVVVVQQLHRRWVRGESKDPRMATVADRIPSLIAAALNVLEESE